MLLSLACRSRDVVGLPEVVADARHRAVVAVREQMVDGQLDVPAARLPMAQHGCPARGPENEGTCCQPRTQRWAYLWERECC